MICLNNREVFDTVREASCKYSVLESEVSGNCKGKYLGLRQSNSGERLVFMYYQDYTKMDEQLIMHKIKLANNSQKRKNHSRATPIICLNNFEVFDCIIDASDEYGINRAKIGMVCMGKRKSAGKINGEPAKWMYYEDYLKMS